MFEAFIMSVIMKAYCSLLTNNLYIPSDQKICIATVLRWFSGEVWRADRNGTNIS